MQKVLVPKEVQDAFNNVKRSLYYVTKEELNLFLMTVPVIGKAGDLKVLAEYAKENPTQYLNALVFGYTSNQKKVLVDMIHSWLNKPYVESEEKDVEDFAEMLITFFQKT